jgi:hypothetical protein
MSWRTVEIASTLVAVINVLRCLHISRVSNAGGSVEAEIREVDRDEDGISLKRVSENLVCDGLVVLEEFPDKFYGMRLVNHFNFSVYIYVLYMCCDDLSIGTEAVCAVEQSN